MRYENWYTIYVSTRPRKYLVFSKEHYSNVFRGYIDVTDQGFFWEDMKGRRVGAFPKRAMALEAFVTFWKKWRGTDVRPAPLRPASDPPGHHS